jgi:formate--tetrahydrofolate ligase
MIHMNDDLKIAQAASLEDIYVIAEKAGIAKQYLEPYGTDKAKINPAFNETVKNNKDGKLILVTAITPTKAGEGKSTTTIGLADGLQKIGKKVMACLREPSLGPVFGLKGGATGGGYAQVVPMESINLHFTGDMHAITSANNLIAAMLDNSIYQGNLLNIDPDNVVWKRCMDMNDRTMRDITIAQDKRTNGVERKDHFVITVATEVMAILCLSKDIKDFEARISRCIVAYTKDGKPGNGKRYWRSRCCYGGHERSDQTESSADTGTYTGIYSWRTIRKYRPWMQLRDCNKAGIEIG